LKGKRQRRERSCRQKKTGKSDARNQFVEGTYASLGSKRIEGMHCKLKERREKKRRKPRRDSLILIHFARLK
jgi:hypothetical protein